MTLSDKIIKLLRYRVEEEEKSSRLYLSMSKWLQFNGYCGAAKLWCKYSEEETVHAQWAYTYLETLGVNPILPAIPQPELKFDGLREIIDMSYDHEVEITKQCKELSKTAMEEGDCLTVTLAHKYLREQIEELGKVAHWQDRLNAFGETDVALRLLDDEMLNKV